MYFHVSYWKTRALALKFLCEIIKKKKKRYIEII